MRQSSPFGKELEECQCLEESKEQCLSSYLRKSAMSEAESLWGENSFSEMVAKTYQGNAHT